MTFTFYVPYWIYDLTKLNLIPSQDKTKESAPAGGTVKVYREKKKEMEVEPVCLSIGCCLLVTCLLVTFLE